MYFEVIFVTYGEPAVLAKSHFFEQQFWRQLVLNSNFSGSYPISPWKTTPLHTFSESFADYIMVFREVKNFCIKNITTR